MRRSGLLIIVLLLAAAVAAAFAAIGDAPDEPVAQSPTTTTTAAPTTPAPTTPAAPEPTQPPATSTTTLPPAIGAPGLLLDVAFATSPWPTDWQLATIDLSELKLGLRGIDPRDRIRPLDFPTYESIASAGDWLIDREIGVQLDLDGDGLFYPLRIMTSHEIVNDERNGLPFVVTYCPLCNTAVAFDRRVDGEVLRFGVSGLLRNSDLVMWDDRTVSLWQQITGEGIVGVNAGKQLEFLPTATVTWADFKERFPDGSVLSQDTGFGFNYGSNGYVGYSSRDAPFSGFFDGELDERFPALERVVGVRVGEATKAYPFSVIAEPQVVDDVVAGVPITVWWGDSGAADNFSGATPGEGEAIGTGIAFLRTVDGQVLDFAPVGPDTFTDSQTGTVWSLLGLGIDGPLAGVQLETALHQNEFWFAWSTFNDGAPVYEG